MDRLFNRRTFIAFTIATLASCVDGEIVIAIDGDDMNIGIVPDNNYLPSVEGGILTIDLLA